MKILIYFLLFVFLILILLNLIKTEDKRKKYIPTYIKKINIGPFLTDDGIRLYTYNPAIAYDQNGAIVGLSRMTGQTSKNCKNTEAIYSKNISEYFSQYKGFPTEKQKNISTLIYWEINSLPKLSIIPLFTKENLSKTNQIEGIEDARFFYFKESLWIYAHYRGKFGNSLESIHTPVIVNYPYNQINMLKLTTDNMTSSEKNWMPFEYNSELYFIYSVFPHTILKCDMNTGYCKKVYQTGKKRSTPVGNGAPPIKVLVNDIFYYLGLAHTRRNEPEVLRKNFFYLFRPTPPFDIVMVGSEFDITDNLIEYGSGMLLSQDSNSIILSVGIDDCYSIITEIPLKQIISDLNPI